MKAMIVKVIQLREIIHRALRAEFERALMEDLESREVLRPLGFRALSDDGFNLVSSWKRSGYVYRGMTKQEYDATIGKGLPIHSTGKYSHSSEGTNFSEDPLDAEGYVNFGKDDPRTTGLPNYLIEVKITESMKLERDGYIKSKDPVPLSAIARVWEMFAENGAVMVRLIS